MNTAVHPLGTLLLVTTSFWSRGVPIVNIHLESNNVWISNHFQKFFVLNNSKLFNKFKQTKIRPTKTCHKWHICQFHLRLCENLNICTSLFWTHIVLHTALWIPSVRRIITSVCTYRFCKLTGILHFHEPEPHLITDNQEPSIKYLSYTYITRTFVLWSTCFSLL